MTLLNENILPYVGTDTFKLGDNLCNIRQSLKHNKIKFNQRIDPNKGCEPEVPWIFIEIENCITLCFAKDILFEIVLENDYTGKQMCIRDRPCTAWRSKLCCVYRSI